MSIEGLEIRSESPRNFGTVATVQFQCKNQTRHDKEWAPPWALFVAIFLEFKTSIGKSIYGVAVCNYYCSSSGQGDFRNPSDHFMLSNPGQVHLFGHIHEQRGHWDRDGNGFKGGVEYRPSPHTPQAQLSWGQMRWWSDSGDKMIPPGSLTVRPWKIAIPKGKWSSNHHFSAAMSNFGGASNTQVHVDNCGTYTVHND